MKRFSRSEQAGFVVWFTGLPSSGKTTVANALMPKLQARGINIERLDGDTVRESLCAGLGFSKEDRDTYIERVTFVAKLLSRNNVGVLASFISPYEAKRAWVRDEVTNFIEVHVSAPVDVCEARDVKGFYVKARAGEVKDFTGISAPYEEPGNPDINLPTHEQTLEESLQIVLDYLEEHGYIPGI